MQLSPSVVRRRVPARLLACYAVIGAGLAAAVAGSLIAGSRETPTVAVGGVYTTSASSACLGGRGGHVSITQSGQVIQFSVASHSSAVNLAGPELSGMVTCTSGGSQALHLRAIQRGRVTDLEGRVGATVVSLDAVAAAAPSAAAAMPLTSEQTFGRLALAVAVVILFARLMGAAVARLNQPRVMGEVVAGILLGPTLLGLLLPGVQSYLFAPSIVPLLGGAADIGLAFFMFLVGLELDPRLIRGRITQAALISNASVALPMALGMLAALPLYRLLGPSQPFAGFALFMGLALSITAVPVLARILVEKRMIKRPLGVLTLAAATVDDVTAWSLLALASAVSLSGSGISALLVVALAVVFCLAMAFIGRPLLARASDAYDEAGHIPEGWVALIFGGTLVCCFLTEQLGVASVFGAFVMGLIMPRNARMSHALSTQIESFVVAVLLPLYFVVVGLKTDVGLLNRLDLWLIAGGLLIMAVAGKWLGAMLAGRVTALSWRDSAAVGALMNTRGLTELIALNIGLDLGIITPALFTMLVVVALVTTFMAGPALRLLDPRSELSAPAGELVSAVPPQLGAGVPAPSRAVLVAVQQEKGLASLLALAEPLTQGGEARELIIVWLVSAQDLTRGIGGDDRLLQRARTLLAYQCRELNQRGITTRAVALTTPDAGQDIVQLASRHNVDLVLLEGRRPMLGDGVPRGAVGEVLSQARCDVAVLVERDGSVPRLGPGRPVVVPFGGAEHDWMAVELAAWIASSKHANLQLLGAAASDATGRDASRLLANASLVVQQFAGVMAEPLLAEPGREGILAAAREAGLLVLGLSERWKDEGLGPVRAAVAQGSSAPTLFVRRGQRPGALASADSSTRFAWSTVGPSPPRPVSPPPSQA